MFTLRPASQADFTAIRRLIRAVKINPMGLDWRRFVVAVTPQGEIIACGQIKPHRDGSHELASIAVAPGWRRMGVARAIIEHLVALYASQNQGKGYAALYLTCRARLGPFYEKFGFRAVQTGQMPPYFRSVSRMARLIRTLHILGEGLLVMKRDL